MYSFLFLFSILILLTSITTIPIYFICKLEIEFNIIKYRVFFVYIVFGLCEWHCDIAFVVFIVYNADHIILSNSWNFRANFLTPNENHKTCLKSTHSWLWDRYMQILWNINIRQQNIRVWCQKTQGNDFWDGTWTKIVDYFIAYVSFYFPWKWFLRFTYLHSKIFVSSYGKSPHTLTFLCLV